MIILILYTCLFFWLLEISSAFCIFASGTEIPQFTVIRLLSGPYYVQWNAKDIRVPTCTTEAGRGPNTFCIPL
jgi:hypothetical protein